MIQWLETGVDPRTQKKGLGDYTEKAIDVVTLGTGKKIANAYKRMTGKDCGCEKRKDILNKTGEELLGFLFKGGNLRCPNPQEREMIKSVVVRNQNGKLAIDTTYTPTQLTQLYNAVTGLNHNVPTCKCQSTINTVAEWINRLNGICDMCDAGEEPR